jgi:ferredoxin
MSDVLSFKGWRLPGTFARKYGAEVIKLCFQPGQRTMVYLSNGRSGLGSCLGCGSPRCMEKEENEFALDGALNSFPGDPSLDVCPTRAIQWDLEQTAVTISEADCIGCGLCVTRCPYGALSLQEGQNGMVASVEISDPQNIVTGESGTGSHPQVEKIGRIAELDAPAALSLQKNVLWLKDSDRKLFVRNLLNEVGLTARTRRKGDSNLRMDAVGFSHLRRPFVAEIEMSSGVLDSPRALLEDVAVLHSRYGYATDIIDPVSIILALPSVRSDYYQVVRDIEKVLGLRCRTLTVGMLIALLWNLRRIQGFDGDAFAIGEGVVDLSGFIADKGEQWKEPYAGAFRPAK